MKICSKYENIQQNNAINHDRKKSKDLFTD